MNPKLDRLVYLALAFIINILLWIVLITVAEKTMDLFK
jgi:hypothetical protein